MVGKPHLTELGKDCPSTAKNCDHIDMGSTSELAIMHSVTAELREHFFQTREVATKSRLKIMALTFYPSIIYGTVLWQKRS
jgi:hypothetical protein